MAKKSLGLSALILFALALLSWMFYPAKALPAAAQTAAQTAATTASKPTDPKPALPSTPAPVPVAPTTSLPTARSLQSAQVPASNPALSSTTLPIDLKSTFKEMIALLEADDLGGFLLKYSSPKSLAAMAQSFSVSRARAAEFRTANNQPPLPDQSFEEALRALSRGPMAPVAKIILSELNALQDITPRLNSAGDEATFAISPALSATLPGNPETITLRKEDGHWYADGLMPD